MENTFNGESYSLGWIEALFLCNKSLSEHHAKMWVSLTYKLNQSKDASILKYVETVYPSLLEKPKTN
jgi:hypothetical protein